MSDWEHLIKKDRRIILIDDTTAFQPGSMGLEPVSMEHLLRTYEEEMRALKMEKDVLMWHLIILENFIKNFLPEHGVVIKAFTQN